MKSHRTRFPLPPPAWVVDDARSMLPVLLDRRRALRRYVAEHRSERCPGLQAFSSELHELRREIAAAVLVLRTDKERSARRRMALLRA